MPEKRRFKPRQRLSGVRDPKESQGRQQNAA